MSSHDAETDAPLRLSLVLGVRQLAKAQTRERVRDAARQLFTSRGFDDTTSQQIADLARVAVGTLFQHASDKEDLLLLTLHDPLAVAIKDALAIPVPDDLLTEFTVLLGSLLEPYADLEVAARAALRAHWFGTGENARAIQWLYETLVEQLVMRLERAQQTGTLAQGADARGLAANLMALYQSTLLEWLWLEDDLEAAVGRLRAALALQLIPLQTGRGPATSAGEAPEVDAAPE